MNLPNKHKSMKLLFIILLFPISILVIKKTSLNEKPNISGSLSQIEKAKEALEYCKNQGFNTDFCILVDMGIHSGKDRMFIWDFNSSSIAQSGLCSHGCGDSPHSGDETKTAPIFSNISDSHLSSLGKYKIGKRGYSNWGIHINYKLHGLETSNVNAYRRLIVLHSWEIVSNIPIYPNGTPEGWGCPAVSNDMMKILDKKLKEASKPVLLWVFN
jgi:hypothetical protein